MTLKLFCNRCKREIGVNHEIYDGRKRYDLCGVCHRQFRRFLNIDL